jgi:hypothetical protein
MRQRAVTTCLVGIVGFMATIAAPAQGIAQESRATAVLNVEAEGADKQLTATLTSILRNEAQQLQGYRVVNKAAINLSEIIVVLGCEASSAQCLTQAAQQLNATTLIYGNLTRDGADWRLKVEIFDAEQQRITYRLQSTIAGKDDLVVAYRSEIERFMRSVREQKDAPKLVINSNVRGAKVKINGEPVGTTPFEREGLKVGMVDLEVSSSWRPAPRSSSTRRSSRCPRTAPSRSRTRTAARSMARSSRPRRATRPRATTSPAIR